MAALDEAVTVLAAHPDRFAETIVRQLRADLFATLGQLDAGETRLGSCAGPLGNEAGAVHVVENARPQARPAGCGQAQTATPSAAPLPAAMVAAGAGSADASVPAAWSAPGRHGGHRW